MGPNAGSIQLKSFKVLKQAAELRFLRFLFDRRKFLSSW